MDEATGLRDWGSCMKSSQTVAELGLNLGHYRPPQPLPFSPALYCLEPTAWSLHCLPCKTEHLVPVQTNLHLRFKSKGYKNSWQHQKCYKNVRLCANAIIKCGRIIWFGFFFFKCCKNSVRGKGSLQQTMDEALWVRDTFIQKLLFGTFSGLSAGFVSRDSEINKTSPSPQGSFWDCQEIKQQLYSGEESARKRDGLEASKEWGGWGVQT